MMGDCQPRKFQVGGLHTIVPQKEFHAVRSGMVEESAPGHLLADRGTTGGCWQLEARRRP